MDCADLVDNWFCRRFSALLGALLGVAVAVPLLYLTREVFRA